MCDGGGLYIHTSTGPNGLGIVAVARWQTLYTGVMGGVLKKRNQRQVECNEPCMKVDCFLLWETRIESLR